MCVWISATGLKVTFIVSRQTSAAHSSLCFMTFNIESGLERVGDRWVNEKTRKDIDFKGIIINDN